VHTPTGWEPHVVETLTIQNLIKLRDEYEDFKRRCGGNPPYDIDKYISLKVAARLRATMPDHRKTEPASQQIEYNIRFLQEGTKGGGSQEGINLVMGELRAYYNNSSRCPPLQADTYYDMAGEMAQNLTETLERYRHIITTWVKTTHRQVLLDIIKDWKKEPESRSQTADNWKWLVGFIETKIRDAPWGHHVDTTVFSSSNSEDTDEVPRHRQSAAQRQPEQTTKELDVFSISQLLLEAATVEHELMLTNRQHGWNPKSFRGADFEGHFYYEKGPSRKLKPRVLGP
jgi:hypothetical protein